jgi:death on curing protein
MDLLESREEIMQLQTLLAEDILLIHEILVQDFATSGDPIEPPGVKSIPLLESAVGRQHTAIGMTLKYPSAIGNAATLMYGICCDHPFHNGNKRTALVAMLAHLDKNNLVLDTKQSALYNLVLDIAAHRISESTSHRGSRKKRRRITHDEEVQYIMNFLEKGSRPLKRGERLIKYRELRRILGKFNIILDETKKNQIKVVRHERVITGLFRKKEIVREVNLGSISYPGDDRDVGITLVKQVRKMCGLSEKDGVDSRVFYDQQAVIDSFVNNYRTILRRLAYR